jgi:hypothetical protein
MTIKLPLSVINFAAGNTSLFENFVDYWNHYRSENSRKKYPYVASKDGKVITLEEKEKALNFMLIEEVEKRSNFDLKSVSLEQASNHPMVVWAAANIVSQMIDAILPTTIIDSTSMYAEVKTLGWGETGVFDIKSRDLFPVTKVGRGLTMRETEMNKGFMNQVTLNPEGHQITVGVSLFRVLSGQESLAEFTNKAIRSIETEMMKDIYNAFAAGMSALSTDATTGLQVTGYTQKDLALLADKVSTYMGGARPVVIGTRVALSNILPDDTNTRAEYDSEYVKVGYIRTISGIDTFEIPQVANWPNPFSTLISNSSLWVIAPGTDKLVKCVIGGSTVSNVSGTFDAANLQQTATFIKNWKAGIVTSSIGGLITIAS